MWKTLSSFFFPKYCVNCRKLGDYICAQCFSYIRFHPTPICAVCNKRSIEGATHVRCRGKNTIDGLVSAVVYAGVIKRLVYQYKYKPYVSGLTDTIGQLMRESLAENEIFYSLLKRNPVLTPVPLSRQRIQKRGYNQAWLLCSYVAQYFNRETHSDILIRNRDTKPQFQLSKSARFHNVSRAFSVTQTKNDLITGRTVVVVDDLATTCSTLCETARILKRNGAQEIWGLVFAREDFAATPVISKNQL